MRKILGSTLAGLALAATAVLGAGSAHAQDNSTAIPGGDSLEANLHTNGSWTTNGSPSCIGLTSELTLWGTNPYYAQSLQNSTSIAAYGGYSTWLTWNGTSGSGSFQAHVSDQTTQGYDWHANLDGGRVCIGQITSLITGHLTGRAYIPQQGNWFYADADLN